MIFPPLPDITPCACGGRASVTHQFVMGERASQVLCLVCKAFGPAVCFGPEDMPHDRADRAAIAAWNARRNRP